MSNKTRKKQIENQAQQGRSMVEMLGVLAIIGVLSIGGIAGYRWGMDKHVSNQILYEMNLNSAQLAMLLQKGNPDGVTLSLGSPYDDGKFRTVDYGFEYACGEEASFGHDCKFIDETIYSMTATGLPKRVCNMLSEAVFGMGYASELEINGGADECDDNTSNVVTVFFDIDTTVEGGIQRPEESETHTPMPEVTEPTTTTTTETATPETTTTTVETTTPEITTTEVTTYISSATYSSTEITTYTSTYTPTPFVTTATANGCNDNNDCEANQYCYFSGSDDCEKQVGTGECRSNTPDIKVNVDGRTFFAKNEYMSCWSAQNFCISNGKQMVSTSDLGCEEGVCSSYTVEKLAEKLSDNSYFANDGYIGSCNAYRLGFYNNGYALTYGCNIQGLLYALCVSPTTE